MESQINNAKEFLKKIDPEIKKREIERKIRNILIRQFLEETRAQIKKRN